MTSYLIQRSTTLHAATDAAMAAHAGGGGGDICCGRRRPAEEEDPTPGPGRRPPRRSSSPPAGLRARRGSGDGGLADCETGCSGGCGCFGGGRGDPTEKQQA